MHRLATLFPLPSKGEGGEGVTLEFMRAKRMAGLG